MSVPARSPRLRWLDRRPADRRRRSAPSSACSASSSCSAPTSSAVARIDEMRDRPGGDLHREPAAAERARRGAARHAAHRVRTLEYAVSDAGAARRAPRADGREAAPTSRPARRATSRSSWRRRRWTRTIGDPGAVRRATRRPSCSRPRTAGDLAAFAAGPAASSSSRSCRSSPTSWRPRASPSPSRPPPATPRPPTRPTRAITHARGHRPGRGRRRRRSDRRSSSAASRGPCARCSGRPRPWRPATCTVATGVTSKDELGQMAAALDSAQVEPARGALLGRRLGRRRRGVVGGAVGVVVADLGLGGGDLGAVRCRGQRRGGGQPQRADRRRRCRADGCLHPGDRQSNAAEASEVAAKAVVAAETTTATVAKLGE